MIKKALRACWRDDELGLSNSQKVMTWGVVIIVLVAVGINQYLILNGIGADKVQGYFVLGTLGSLCILLSWLLARAVRIIKGLKR